MKNSHYLLLTFRQLVALVENLEALALWQRGRCQGDMPVPHTLRDMQKPWSKLQRIHHLCSKRNNTWQYQL